MRSLEELLDCGYLVVCPDAVHPVVDVAEAAALPWNDAEVTHHECYGRYARVFGEIFADSCKEYFLVYFREHFNAVAPEDGGSEKDAISVHYTAVDPQMLRVLVSLYEALSSEDYSMLSSGVVRIRISGGHIRVADVSRNKFLGLQQYRGPMPNQALLCRIVRSARVVAQLDRFVGGQATSLVERWVGGLVARYAEGPRAQRLFRAQQLVRSAGALGRKPAALRQGVYVAHHNRRRDFCEPMDLAGSAPDVAEFLFRHLCM